MKLNLQQEQITNMPISNPVAKQIKSKNGLHFKPSISNSILIDLNILPELNFIIIHNS
tara:strand:+ start:1660 stop:1833 length:174 start_codon:yes stop_codon:yes gene_type:complete